MVTQETWGEQGVPDGKEFKRLDLGVLWNVQKVLTLMMVSTNA
jgi:hypothetical protein